jgi:aminopeptidase N
LSKHKSFHIPGSFRHYLPDKDYRTEHIRVELKVDPEEKTISGKCALRIVPIRDDIRALRFDAREMEITKVTLDDSETGFDYDGDVLAVKPDGPIAAGRHEVKIEYSSTPKHGVYFIHPDDAYPHKLVQVWTQSESEAARYWFPCQDHPDDRSTTETIISVPEGYQVISNGKLISKQSTDGWAAFHWSESTPHSTYLNSFVVGKFVEIDERVEGVPLQYYVPEQKQRDTTRYFGLTPDMMTTFIEVTGFKFPFEKYAQVAVQDFVYGGMENISATTMTDARFPDERSEEDYAARYSRPDRTHVELVAHELAHSWFGDLITMKHWPHNWLNEGFATYMDSLYQERKFGVDEFREFMRLKAELYFDEDEHKYRRAIVTDDYMYADDLFDAYAYEKACWMLHQLRYLLGDQVFFSGIRDYVKRFAYKNVDTHDLMRSLEESSGISLEDYFEQSFYTGGHPVLEAEYSWDASGMGATVTISQTQTPEDQTTIFRLPCDIVFYTDKGREVRRVWIKAQEQTYYFELASEPKIVEIDPQGWLLKRLKFTRSRALLLNQLGQSQDALSRAEAAESLSTFSDKEVIDALKNKAADASEHWSVGARAARSIGKIGGKGALNALLDLRSVRNRRVRRAVIAALADFKGDDRVYPVLEEALFHDESPYVQCEAALSLGRCGAPDAVKTLNESMGIPSPEHGLTEASLEALGLTKKEEVRKTLRENVVYGKPTRVRVGAIKGFTKLGSLEGPDVEELKTMLLKDPDFTVRFELLGLTSELKDKRFVATLRKVADADQDRRAKRRAVEILLEIDSQSPDAGLTSLKEEVERLKRETQEVKDRFSRSS